MIWILTLLLPWAGANSNPVADAFAQVGLCQTATTATEITSKVKAALTLADPSRCGVVEWSPKLDQQLLQEGYELTSFSPAYALPNGYQHLIQMRFEYTKPQAADKKTYTRSCELSYSAKVYIQKHPVNPCALNINLVY